MINIKYYKLSDIKIIWKNIIANIHKDSIHIYNLFSVKFIKTNKALLFYIILFYSEVMTILWFNISKNDFVTFIWSTFILFIISKPVLLQYNCQQPTYLTTSLLNFSLTYITPRICAWVGFFISLTTETSWFIRLSSLRNCRERNTENSTPLIPIIVIHVFLLFQLWHCVGRLLLDGIA